MTRDRLLQHVLQFDPELFVDKIMTFDEEANGALSQERMLASIGSLLGAAALILLVIGLYGTMAAAVIRSRRELGIRLALGARPRSLRALVVARSLLVAGAGLMLGLPLAYAATKSFAHLLYGVRPARPARRRGHRRHRARDGSYRGIRARQTRRPCRSRHCAACRVGQALARDRGLGRKAIL